MCVRPSCVSEQQKIMCTIYFNRPFPLQAHTHTHRTTCCVTPACGWQPPATSFYPFMSGRMYRILHTERACVHSMLAATDNTMSRRSRRRRRYRRLCVGYTSTGRSLGEQAKCALRMHSIRQSDCMSVVCVCALCVPMNTRTCIGTKISTSDDMQFRR